MNEYVPILGFEEFYLINKVGDIKITDYGLSRINNSRKNITPVISKKGYLNIRLTDKEGKRVTIPLHRAILSSFDKVNPKDLQVNHIDGDKKNNALENLEWVTCKENMEHKVKLGLQAKGEKVGTSKLNEENVIFIRQNYIPYCKTFGTRGLGRMFGVEHKTILSVLERKTWTHVGGNNRG